MIQSISCNVNGQTLVAECPAGASLLGWLRDQGHYEVRRVCETGDCGACTVWVDGEAIHSCLYPARRSSGRQITTISGLNHALQKQFLDHQGFQCGFCTAGMIMSAAKLPGQPQQTLKGNLCRCTGYQVIVASIENAPVSIPTSQFGGTRIGQSLPKQDGEDIVTGQAVYTGDFSLPGLLHLWVLRSPHAHAKIRHIDPREALALPGVVAVFTHGDVPRRPYTTAGHAEPVPDPLDHYLLDDRVRFVGDRVAAVVAESVSLAQQACGLIKVDYEILPHVLDPEAALAGPPIHPEPESRQIFDAQHNIAGQVQFSTGNLDQGWAEADLIVTRTYHLPAVQHVHLEPHISISWLDEAGNLVVRSSTQVPFHCQRVLGELFDLPLEKVRVYKAKIGGGFGNKQEILSEDLCALATLKTGRPVQWEFTRGEEFTATNSRHAMVIELQTGVKNDGTLTAMEMRAIANTGAYGNHAPTVVFLTGYLSLGMYRCAHKAFLGKSVYTNTMPAGAFRGYGATQGIFAIESQLDEIAAKLGLDPVQLRLQNLIQPGDRLTMGRDDTHFNLIGSYALPECLAKVTAAFKTRLPAPTAPHLKRGVGFAVAMQGSGLSKIHAAGAKLTLEADGKFCLRVGAVDVGTGSDTSLCQVAAEILGVGVADLRIISADTAETPFDAGSYASATMYISGQAVRLAALQMRELLAGKPEPGLTTTAEYTASESTLTFAAQGVEVEVDTQTGRVEVLRSVQAIDIGVAINPRICLGQATGGTVMGLGYALSEELSIDGTGQIRNPNLRYYRIPTAADVPPMEVHLVESPDPHGPFGAKGVGEITTNCIAPAIANAIAQATGIRLTKLPMTPERVWQQLWVDSRC